MTLWLVGMMGSGKTVAGRLAAEHLGVPFVDVDEVISTRHGASIPQLWTEKGETFFREEEMSVIEGVAGSEGIVSTGGGAVIEPANRRLMSASGTVVWLQAHPQAIVSRLQKSQGRPLLDGAEDRDTRLAVLLEERSAAYGDVADHEIDTSELSVEEVALRIEGLWPS